MPFDACPAQDPWRSEPSWPLCQACKRPIAAHEPFERVQFDYGDLHRLQAANGIYHAACAKPILSLGLALETMKGFVR